jgi:hypothetical protein
MAVTSVPDAWGIGVGVFVVGSGIAYGLKRRFRPDAFRKQKSDEADLESEIAARGQRLGWGQARHSAPPTTHARGSKQS